MNKTPQPLLELSQVRKTYNLGRPNEAEVLHGIDLRVNTGEFIALMGPSGSGKSTLMQCVAGLDRLTSGEAYIAPTEPSVSARTTDTPP